MDTREFGSFIAEQRKSIGMTQRELAEKLQVTDKAVSRWENGHGYPDIETLEELATALDLSLLELMHSKKNAEGSVTVEEASRAVSETIHMNIDDRRRERRITIVVLAFSLLLILLLSIFKNHLTVALVASGIGMLYLVAAILLLVEYGRSKRRALIFFSILLLLIPLSILFLLMTTQVTIT